MKTRKAPPEFAAEREAQAVARHERRERIAKELTRCQGRTGAAALRLGMDVHKLERIISRDFVLRQKQQSIKKLIIDQVILNLYHKAIVEKDLSAMKKVMEIHANVDPDLYALRKSQERASQPQELPAVRARLDTGLREMKKLYGSLPEVIEADESEDFVDPDETPAQPAVQTAAVVVTVEEEDEYEDETE